MLRREQGVSTCKACPSALAISPALTAFLKAHCTEDAGVSLSKPERVGVQEQCLPHNFYPRVKRAHPSWEGLGRKKEPDPRVHPWNRVQNKPPLGQTVNTVCKRSKL